MHALACLANPSSGKVRDDQNCAAKGCKQAASVSSLFYKAELGQADCEELLSVSPLPVRDKRLTASGSASPVG